jgi:hypothetical protein
MRINPCGFMPARSVVSEAAPIVIGHRGESGLQTSLSRLDRSHPPQTIATFDDSATGEGTIAIYTSPDSGGEQHPTTPHRRHWGGDPRCWKKPPPISTCARSPVTISRTSNAELDSAHPRQRIQFGRRQGRQEGIRHNRVYARGADVLAGRQALVGTQMVTYILPAAFVADVHFVTAPRAPGDAVQ